MKTKCFLFVALLLSIATAHAQSQKPTGGCQTLASIEQINHVAQFDTVLTNGESYVMDVAVSFEDNSCSTPLDVFLGTLHIGNCPWTKDRVTITLDKFYVTPGNYDLSVVYDIGKTSRKVTIASPTALGVKNTNGKPDIVMYPVPATDILHLETTRATERIMSIRMINSCGELKQISYPGSSNAELQVNELPAGMYIVQMQTTDNFYNEKIMIAH